VGFTGIFGGLEFGGDWHLECKPKCSLLDKAQVQKDVALDVVNVLVVSRADVRAICLPFVALCPPFFPVESILLAERRVTTHTRQECGVFVSVRVLLVPGS